MSDNILVCVAWPYANGPIHHGQLGGAYLPADIFARYHRIRGNRVAMVSGSDTHGTPITVRADEEGKHAAERSWIAEFHPVDSAIPGRGWASRSTHSQRR